MAGRPPKPTALKVLHGTNQPCRSNPKEPKPAADKVKAPTWLSKGSRKHWRKIEPVLRDMNILTNADVTALAMLCDALTEYIEAQAVLQEQGRTYQSYTAEGAMMWRPRPEVAISNDAWRRVHSMMTQFGMTPSSRTKVQAVSEPETASPFDQWMKRRSS